MVDKKINYCSSIKCSKKMVKIIQQILTGQCFALENPCYTASGTTKYKALVISIKVYTFNHSYFSIH